MGCLPWPWCPVSLHFFAPYLSREHIWCKCNFSCSERSNIVVIRSNIQCFNGFRMFSTVINDVNCIKSDHALCSRFHNSTSQIWNKATVLPWENNLLLAKPPLVSPRIDSGGTHAEIPYWWRINTQSLVVLLIGWNKLSTYQPISTTCTGYWVVTRHQVWNFCVPSSDVISAGNHW